MSNVKLVWATPEGDSLLARMARVSNPENQDNPDSARLISYLIRNKHWSPFEMVSACLEINTTRDIGRQILRHRSFSFQEFSQRYADVTALPEAGFRECRLQDPVNRQNSLLNEDMDRDVWWRSAQHHVLQNAQAFYELALQQGVAKEQARALLPEGLTPSRMYMAGTLRSWLHYIGLRTEDGTQKEHRVIAEQARQILVGSFPAAFKALEVYA